MTILEGKSFLSPFFNEDVGGPILVVQGTLGSVFRITLGNTQGPYAVAEMEPESEVCKGNCTISFWSQEVIISLLF